MHRFGYFLTLIVILLVNLPGTVGAKTRLVDFNERDAEFLMLQEINIIRYNEGLPLVAIDDTLSVSCRRHAMDMAVRDYFDHYSPEGYSPGDRAKNLGIANPVSENIGITRTFGREDTGYIVDLLMDGFLNSPEHRINILDPNVTHVGLGYWQDLDDSNKRLASGRDPDTNYLGFGTVLVVQEFIRREVELIEPSPYEGWTKPGEFMTVTFDFTDEVDDAFLRVTPVAFPRESYEIPLSKSEKCYQARFAIEEEGEFVIGIYANSRNADWYYRERGQLELTVAPYLY